MSARWVARCLFPLIFATIATCIPAQKNETLQPHQYKGVVRGIDTRDEYGHPYLRLEVRELKANYPDQWNLYLLAMERLQLADQNDPFSYHALAGIHGRPYRIWEDAPGLNDKIGQVGYCPHNNALFFGWHRPYLAVYEQTLYEYMLEIASKAPEDQVDRYTAAANAFRIPYWDWAQGVDSGPVPEFFFTEAIGVIEVDGTHALMNNPLYSYFFRPLNPDGFDAKWRYINETVRWPTSDDLGAKSQSHMVTESFISQSKNIRTGIAVAFRRSSFDSFTKEVESPHGYIHGVVGGGWSKGAAPGHFWPLEYSAYDPLFMLHHANVDRLAAIYQAAHPDRWMNTSNVGDNGNVFLEDYQTIDADTQLLPFRRESGTFWTTNECRNTTVLGYTYPETQRWWFPSDEESQAYAQSVIADLYSDRTRELLTAQQHATAGGHTQLVKNSTFTDWTIESQIDRTDTVPSTFIVRFSIIGDDQTNHTTIDVGAWMRLMPSTHAPASPHRTVISSTSFRQPLQGTTSLTAHLLDLVAAGRLASLDPDDVVPFLTDRLAWGMYLGNGEDVAPEVLGQLTVQVFSAPARIPEEHDALIHVSAEEVRWAGITVGKKGGVRG